MSIASDTGAVAGPVTLQLEPVLDLGAAERLHATLMGLRGQAVDIDASQVERLGGLCLQVLISARDTWRADGHSAVIGHASTAFEEAWSLFAAPSFSEPPSPLGTEGQDA